MGRKKQRYGIHHWHLVVQKWSEIVLRVIELDALGREGREISLKHVRSEHAGLLQRLRRVLAYALIIGKKEEFISCDGTAQGSAEYILSIFRDGTSRSRRL